MRSVSSKTVAPDLAVVFVLTFLLRFQAANFLNDHFTHLSRARQILLGEWPIRDFFDPGQFLHYYLSAAAQLVFGYGLFGEALLTASFMALGAALTYGVSERLSGSRAIAAGATLASVIAMPRLYNYPKVFLYVAAIWLAWWYAHRPERKRIRALAALAALAFLFRYDHGAYIAGLMVVLLTLVHMDRPRQWLTSVASFAGLFCVFLIPFGIYVQWATGLPRYTEASRSSLRNISRDARRSLGVRFTFDNSLPTAVEPDHDLFEEPRAPQVNGLLTRDNARSWFTGVTVVLPYLALLLCVWAWRRGTIARPEAAAVAATACLCLVISRTLMAGHPDARLPDVAPPTAALGAWVAGRWLTVPASRARDVTARIFRYFTLSTLFAVTVWSVSTQAQLVPTLQKTGVLDGPRAAWAAMGATYRQLRLHPIDDWAPPGAEGNLQRIARYIQRCTSSDDRLLIAGGFAPDVYFYTERAFAGGQVHFMEGWHASLPEQRLTLDRLRHQSVPIVLMGDQDEGFERGFPWVADYIRTRYAEAPFAGNADDRIWRVLVDRLRTPSGTDPMLGLPCYRTPGEE